MTDTICLWVGRVVVIGGLAYLVTLIGYCAYAGFFFLREWRKP